MTKNEKIALLVNEIVMLNQTSEHIKRKKRKGK